MKKITVLEKILPVFLNLEKSYIASSDILLKLYYLLNETLLEIPVVLDFKLIRLNRVFYNSVNRLSTDSTKTTCFLISQQKFLELITFSKTNFLIEANNDSAERNDCDEWLDSTFILLEYITRELPFDTLFTNNNYLVGKAIQLQKDFFPNILAIRNLRKNGYFIQFIAEIQEKLSLLRDKILKSGRTEYALSNSDARKYGLAQLQELLETLFGESKKQKS